MRSQLKRNIAGFSLVEMMVAMVVSLVLLGGTLAVFTGSRKTYASIEQLSRVQENGRFALDQIVRDIRAAGYVGCAKAVPTWKSMLNTPTALPYNFANPIQGYEAAGAGSWAPTLDSSLSSASVANFNDVLVIRMPTRWAVATRIASNMATGAGDISAPSTPLTVGNIAMISNCQTQIFFQVTGISGNLVQHAATGTPGNSSGDFGYAFTAKDEIIPVTTSTYYLAPSAAGTSRALWRISNDAAAVATATELVEGIDGMQVLFGLDTDGDQNLDSYVPASSTIDWTQVMAVRVAILASSIDQYGTDYDRKNYDLLGSFTGSFNDRRIRQVFTSTVAVRNRAL